MLGEDTFMQPGLAASGSSHHTLNLSESLRGTYLASSSAGILRSGAASPPIMVQCGSPVVSRPLQGMGHWPRMVSVAGTASTGGPRPNVGDDLVPGSVAQLTAKRQTSQMSSLPLVRHPSFEGRRSTGTLRELPALLAKELRSEPPREVEVKTAMQEPNGATASTCGGDSGSRASLSAVPPGLHETVEELKGQLATQQERFATALARSKAQQEADLSRMKQDFEASLAQYQEALAPVSNQQQRLADIEAVVCRAEMMLQQQQGMHQEKMQASSDDLQKLSAHLHEALEEQQVGRQKQAEELAGFLAEWERYKARSSPAEAALANQDTLQKEVEALRKEVQTLRNELPEQSRHQVDIAGSLGELGRTVREVSATTTAMQDSFASELEGLRKEVADISAKTEHIANDSSSMYAKVEDVISLQRVFEEMRTSFKDEVEGVRRNCHEELLRLRSDVTSTKALVDQQEQRVCSTFTSVSELGDRLEQVTSALGRRLNELEGKLESLGESSEATSSLGARLETLEEKFGTFGDSEISSGARFAQLEAKLGHLGEEQFQQRQQQEQLLQRQAEPRISPDVLEDILAELSMLKATLSARDSAAELEKDLRDLEVAEVSEMAPRLDRLERENKEVHMLLQTFQKQLATTAVMDDRRPPKQPGPLPSLLTGAGYQGLGHDGASEKALAEDSAAAAAVLEDLQRSRLAETNHCTEGL